MTSEIYIGSVESPLFHFSNDPAINSLIECTAEASTDLISSELPIDTLTFSIDDSFLPENSVISFETIPSGTKVFYYYGNIIVGKFYMNRLTKTGKHRWTFECENYIGLLDNSQFYGLFYQESDGITFETAVKHILLSDGIRVFRPCESVSVKNTTVPELRTVYSTTAVTEAHFRYNGLSDSIRTGSSLSERLYFYGVMYSSDTTLPRKAAYRAIYADITRTSTSVRFNERVLLRFDFGANGTLAYPDKGLALIQISPKTEVHIKIDPVAGKITVNEKEFSFNAVGGTASAMMPFVGALEAHGNGDSPTSLVPGVDLTWYSHKVSGMEFTFVENTAMGYVTTQRKNADGTWGAYPSYRKSGVRKGVFSEIAYRAEESHDGYYPFSFPDSESIEVANAISFENNSNYAKVVGVIPTTSKRDALHQLMFGCGICMRQDGDGNFMFSYLLSEASESTSIPDTSVFDTGDISYDNSVNRLSVSAYEVSTPTYDEEQLQTAFTNEDAHNTGALHSIASLGDTPWVIYKNDTAVLNSRYFTNGLAVFYTGGAILMGLPCAVSEHKYTWDVGNPYGKRQLDVSGCKLITPTNVDTVGEKLKAYYENYANVRNDIIYGGERCGEKFDFTNPFMEGTSGYLTHMSLTAHGFIRASCEYVINFAPPSTIGGYRNRALLTGDGSFTLPDNVVFPIKIVLIGGGQGGSSGYYGEDGEVLSASGGSGNGGAGGEGGSGGQGGLVYTVILRESGVKTFEYSCGAGGKGGTAGAGSEAGHNGWNTTFGAYNSNLGDTLSNGFTDPLNSTVYARPGQSGVKGGDGGGVKRYKIMAGTYAFNYPAAGYAYNADGGNASEELVINSKVVASGAGGGGAAYNANGNDAEPAMRSGTKVTNAYGGLGASAGKPQSVSLYGSGGNGGNGGGGGGASGTGNASGYTFTQGEAGQGGMGSDGGDGANGCVLVFYNTKGENNG